MKRSIWIILIIIGVVAIYLYSTGKSSYNTMVTQQEMVDGAWAEVQNQYQRRADLIPNLVNTVKGYKDFEQETLTRVTEARARVGQMNVTKEVLENPELLKKFEAAQGELSSALSRLLVVTENYPELKANENFKNLMVQLEGTENRITVARQRFNDQAREYNSYVRQFPQTLFANFFGFESYEYFQAAQGSEQAPSVSF